MELMNDTKSSFLPELTSPVKVTRTPLSKYQSQKNSMINPYGSPHISHATQGPIIGRSKHVDYYKHMKEKYRIKKA